MRNKHKAIKKLLSIFLVAAMLFSAMPAPLPAAADEPAAASESGLSYSDTGAPPESQETEGQQESQEPQGSEESQGSQESQEVLKPGKIEKETPAAKETPDLNYLAPENQEQPGEAQNSSDVQETEAGELPVALMAVFQEEAIPFNDQAFYRAVCNLLDKAYGGSIFPADVANITTLDLSWRMCSDLSGIEYFTALEYLNCDINQLTSLDLSNNPALTHLYCDINQLTSLDLSNNPALTVLSCYGNQLTGLDLSNNPALTYLNCYDNRLTSLDLSNNPALTHLYCSNNQLTSLDLLSNPALTHLDCYDNQLTGLDLSNNPALTHLYCNNNHLIRLDLLSNPALTHLDCYDNQLTNLDLSNNPALAVLYCNDNQLTSLDLSNNPALEILYCYDNQLTGLDLFNKPALVDLRCDNNQLTSLDLSANTTLSWLQCDNNPLTSLDLSANTTLSWLQCNNNQLTSLDLSHNPALRDLYCYNNQLTSLDLSHNQKLMYLDCCNNYMSSESDISGLAGLSLYYFNFNPQRERSGVELTGISVARVPDKTAYTAGETLDLTGLLVTAAYSNGSEQDVTGLIYCEPAAGAGLAETDTTVTVNYVENDVVWTANFTITVSAKDEAIQFANDAFYQAVCDMLGKSYSEPIYPAEVAGVTELNLDLLEISDLSGIEYFTALENFSCYGNQLESLVLSANTALTYLNCSYSYQLASLDVSGNPALEKLECANTMLTSLDLRNCPALTTLNCRDSWLLASLDVSNCAALEYLDCNRGQLTSLNLSNCPALTYLDCAQNQQLTSLYLSGSGNPALETLKCHFNSLEYLDVSSCPVLTYLSCQNNQLAELDVSNNTALTYLDCGENRLTSLDVLNNLALTTLKCDDNVTVKSFFDPISYTVTFNGNGGTPATETKIVTYPDTTVETLPTAPTRTSYSFTGWNTASDGSGTAFTGTTPVTGDITVYAQWSSTGGSSGGGGGGGGGSSASISPSSVSYNLSSGNDLSFTLSPWGYTLRNLTNGSNTLVKDTDYTVSGNTVTIKAEYLTALAAGQQIITFEMSGGTNPKLTITLTGEDTTAEESEVQLETKQTPLASVAPANPFTDVSESDWFINAVLYVYNNNLMSGTSDSPVMFSPNTNLTRGMTVTVLYRQAGSPDVSSLTNPFNDLPDNEYYTAAVKWAAENGIVSGYGDGKFGPNDNVTREQLASIIYRYQGFSGKAPADKQASIDFADAGQISAYAIEAVNKLALQEVISGKPGNIFDPQGNATRAEFASILQRLLTS